MDQKILLAVWSQYGGRIVGTLFGFLIGFIFLWVGLLKMLIFSFLVIGGYWLGYQQDHREGLKQMIDRIKRIWEKD